MPDCGGNDYLRLEGINDGSYLQFALQTVENYSISLSGLQLVNMPKSSKQFCAFGPRGGTFQGASASYISGSLRLSCEDLGFWAFAANLINFR